MNFLASSTLRSRCLLLAVCLSLPFFSGCGQLGRTQSIEVGSGLVKPGVKQNTRRIWVISENSSLIVFPVRSTLLNEQQRFRTQQQLQLALSYGFSKVDITLKNESTNSIKNEYHFYVVPELLKAVDRVNSVAEAAQGDYSAGVGQDYVHLKLLLYDAPTGELMDTTVLSVYSSPLSFSSIEMSTLVDSAFHQYALGLSAMGL